MRLTLSMVLAAGMLAGCGPISATSAIHDASVAIESARGAKAPQFAVYEFVSAELYLRKAREEEGYSDFQAAIDFARKASTLATRAKTRATSRTRQGMQPAPSGAMEPTRRPAAVVPDQPPADELPPPSDGLPSGSSL